MLNVSPSVQAAKEEQKKAETPWVWPLPPEQPRVQHTATVITPDDLGVKKGFFAKVWEFIAGADTADRIVSPHGVCADNKGGLYVVDWGAGEVHYFDFEKKKYRRFGKTKKGGLSSPIGAALDGDGLLYVTDSAHRRVYVYDGTKNTRTIGDEAALSWQRPTGIAVNKKEKLLYIVDTLGHRIDVLDLAGKRRFSFGRRGSGQGEFNYPTHIAVDSVGDVYVMDSLNFRVQIFSFEGKYLASFGGNGRGIGEFIKPKGIAVDSEGHIWVSDGLRNSVQVFDRKGRLLLIFGRSGTARGEFNVPAGLFIDGSDRVYVADSYNYRVQMFQYLGEKK